MPEKTEIYTAELGFTPESLERHSKRTRNFGIGFILLGIAAILLPGIFTIGFEVILGILLLVGGALQILQVLSFSKHKGAALPMITGCLSAFLGLLFLTNPFKGAAVLTVFLAALFLINGLLRIIHGIQLKNLPGTGWAMLSGIAGVIIALLVWSAWPTSAEWFIGLLLGVDFLILGTFLVSFASATKNEVSG